MTEAITLTSALLSLIVFAFDSSKSLYDVFFKLS